MNNIPWVEKAYLPQDSDHIKEMLECLAPLSITEYDNLIQIWESMNRLFGHLYNEHLITQAISKSKFWKLLLEGLK